MFRTADLWHARQPMATSPLTHHEIIGLVAPYARRGLQVDLPASPRQDRRLLFKPQTHAGLAPGGSDLSVTLQLDNPAAGRYRLTRRLTLPGGLEARLEIDGAEPGVLLDAAQAVPLARQFFDIRDCVVALDQHLVLRADTPQQADLSQRVTLTHATALVGGLTLKLRVPVTTGVPADIQLLADPFVNGGVKIELPDDLLAVLGWPWSRLQRVQQGWTGVLRLSGADDLRVGGKGALRSRCAEVRLRLTVEHLAQTLHETPQRFHERQHRRRWGVTLRRAVPALGSVGLLLGAAAVPRIDLAEDSVLRMLIFHAPPLLLVGFFCLREMPRIEIPPLPSVANAGHWPEPPLPTEQRLPRDLPEL
jgi:hypothetical protein